MSRAVTGAAARKLCMALKVRTSQTCNRQQVLGGKLQPSFWAPVLADAGAVFSNTPKFGQHEKRQRGMPRGALLC